MPYCILCKKSQSKLNEGDRAVKDSESILLGVTTEQLNNLPELPQNWINEPFQNLTGGHLLRIMLQTNKTITEILDKMSERIETLEIKNLQREVEIQKNMETITSNSDNIEMMQNDVNTLKKGMLQQQIFLENIQRGNLGKNVMITGIPCKDVIHQGQVLSDTKEKVNAILNEIGITLNENEYQIITFNVDDDKPTCFAKVILKKIETKQGIIKESKCLKDNEVFRGVYIKNDETKLARNENYRLRKKARELRAEFPESCARWHRGG